MRKNLMMGEAINVRDGIEFSANADSLEALEEAMRDFQPVRVTFDGVVTHWRRYQGPDGFPHHEFTVRATGPVKAAIAGEEGEDEFVQVPKHFYGALVLMAGAFKRGLSYDEAKKLEGRSFLELLDTEEEGLRVINEMLDNS